MRPWQPDMFNEAPDPKPPERRANVRPYEPPKKGFRRKAPEMSERESERYPSSPVDHNRKERTSEPTDTPEATGNDHD